MSNEKENDTVVSQKNISYYNTIAGEYDALLKKDKKNALIRRIVADRFCARVKKGWILDMGGGTGEDMEWLLRNEYKIIFCEPSKHMRKIAVKKKQFGVTGKDIIFLTQTDFRKWDAAFSFEHRPKGILMNFAVLNCIPDIQLLFHTITGLVDSGTIVFALVLNSNFMAILQKSLVKGISNLIFGTLASFDIRYQERHQSVYYHTKHHITKATAPYFVIKEWEVIAGSGFVLMQLIKQ